MTYPQNFEQKIGFDHIRRLLTDECVSAMGADLVARIGFMTDFEKLQLYLQQTLEMKRVLMLESPFPAADYFDLRAELKRLAVKGSFISIEGLQDLAVSYTVLCELKKYLLSLDEAVYPHLRALAGKLEVVAELPHRIGFLIDPLTHKLRDNASEELYRIRSRMRRLQSESNRQIQKYLASARKEGWAVENAEATVRNERLVIPLHSAHKRQIRGFIHDVSATGQTVFLEPEEVFLLNNELTELRHEERVEITKILREFSLYLYPLLPVLTEGYAFLGRIDFIRAKAKMAMNMEAGLPVVNEKPCFTWRAARHPLLKDPVPLTFCLEGPAGANVAGSGVAGAASGAGGATAERIVIISGPNAGGKSVCLKTVGLLQYMLQCGLLVPMSENSEMGLFRHIFVDIGDEQSIENDLSTYSSHLKNMKFWLEKADRHTLFLADELGSGTEPQVGGAIAEALLESLDKKGAWGVVTTHYTQLKLLAKHHAAMVNGAMLFNKAEMRPLYIFKKGLPGSSFAFEMARQIGFPGEVLQAAQAKTGRQHLQFEQELQQIEVEKQQLLQRAAEVDTADRLLSDTLEKYRKLTAEIEERKTAYLKEAKAQATNIVSQANRRIEQTIREIKEQQAERKETQRIRQQLQNDMAGLLEDDAVAGDGAATGGAHATDGVTTTPLGTKPFVGTHFNASANAAANATNHKHAAQAPTSTKPNTPAPLQAGSLVRRAEGKEVGVVVEIKGRKAKVDFDFMRLELPLDQLKALSPQETRQELERQGRVMVHIDQLQSGRNAFAPYIDLRGERMNDALAKTDKLIDEAVLYGESHLEILHGKGNGILKENIRKLLKQNPHVAFFDDQREELGGAGITLVTLKR